MQELDFLPPAQKGKISLSAPFIMLVLNCATKNISSYPHAPGVKNAARAPQRVAWKATLNKLAVGQEGALQLYGTVLLRMAAVQVMDPKLCNLPMPRGVTDFFENSSTRDLLKPPPPRPLRWGVATSNCLALGAEGG